MARHQIGQIVDHPAGLRQQVRYVFIPNAKAVNFKADFMGHPNGIVCGQMVVWHAVSITRIIFRCSLIGSMACKPTTKSQPTVFRQKPECRTSLAPPARAA